MRYLRGTETEFLSKRLRYLELSHALGHGSGKFLYIYDDNESLLKIIELKDNISFAFIYKAYRNSTQLINISDNLYDEWAEAILKMEGINGEDIEHHVHCQKGST